MRDQEERAARFEEAARRYSRQGFALIRCEGKEPQDARWQKSVAGREELEAGKWSRWGRRSNMGVHLGGSRPPMSVLEPDTPEAWRVMLELLGGELPPVPTVRSGGKSVHLYYLDSGQGYASRDGLELRSDRQQCLLPPSAHPATGREYEWLDGRAPWQVDLTPIPRTVLDYFGRASRNEQAAPVGEEIPVGERHRTLVSLAGSMRRRGMTAAEIRAALAAVNEARCKPPLSAGEVDAIADDVAARYDPAPPDPAREELYQKARRLLGGNQAELAVRPAGRRKPAAWEAPVPLATRPAVPAFPLDALPRWLAEWAREVSCEKGAAVDLAATLSLGVVAGALARHVQVSPRPGWWEPVNLYLAVALEPGQRKSPIFKQALRPIRLLERDLAADWEKQWALATLSGEILQKRRRELITDAADDDELDSEELRRRMEEMAGSLDEPDPTPQPRLLTEDVTAEGLASLLAQHGRIIAASDEGSAIFENFAGRYTRGSSSWDLFNKAHAGVDLAVDRKSTGAVIVLDPALTLVIATQPSVLRDLWGKPGTEDRGVLARPLYSLPEPMFATGRTPAADGTVLDDFDRRVRALFADIPTLRIDDQHRPQPVTLTLDPHAERIFEQYELELANRRRDLGISDHAKEEGAYLGWLSKLAGQTARLAAVLHAAKHWTDGATMNTTIGRRSADSAVELARYFHDNALAVFGLMEEAPNQRLARVILGWLSNRPAAELAKLTVRDVHRSRGNSVTAEQVQAALRLLETHAFVRLHTVSPGTQGGRPSRRVEVNPSLSALPESDRQNRQNTEHGEVLSVPSVTLRSGYNSGLALGEPIDQPLHPDPGCTGTGAWLARDRRWRCTACNPPAFPAEVLEQHDPYTQSPEGDKR